MNARNNIRTALLSSTMACLLCFASVVYAEPVSFSIALKNGYDVSNGYAPIDVTGTLNVSFDNILTGETHTNLTSSDSITDAYYNNPATVSLTLDYSVPTTFQSTIVGISSQFYNYAYISVEQFRLHSYSDSYDSYLSLVIGRYSPPANFSSAIPKVSSPGDNLDLLHSVLTHSGEGGYEVDVAQYVNVYDRTGAFISQNVLAWKGVITSIDTPISAVPEPGTYAMILAGLGLMGVVIRRRKGVNKYVAHSL